MNHTHLFILPLTAIILATSAYAQDAVVKTRKPQQTATTSQDPVKFDTKLPVEITSDNLEVLQRQNKAIFKGNVVAVQGEVRLKSDTMIVHYKQKSGQPETKQPTPATGQPPSQGDMGAITLIEVVGNVLVATPEESAKGDRGDYDVPTRTLHLTGDNVVLTRDKNIMRGTALEYNMETGRSILSNSGTRVHSLFVPNQDQNPGAKKK